TAFGEAGEDLLRGGTGDDWRSGNELDDVIAGGEGDDDLYGGAGDDDLFGEEGDDELWGDRGDDLLNGGSGDNDHALYKSSIDEFSISLDAEGNVVLTDHVTEGQRNQPGWNPQEGRDTLVNVEWVTFGQGTTHEETLHINTLRDRAQNGWTGDRV
ncbi:MAG: hypothetical protein AAGM38_15845, partial [Pseudomonadota bacterium]